jgi:hypothetical protein
VRYFQCKCGEAKSWSSMGQPSCRRCSKCGSDLAEGPSSHCEPSPHDWKQPPVATDAGEVPGESICILCLQKRKDVPESEGGWKKPAPQPDGGKP